MTIEAVSMSLLSKEIAGKAANKAVEQLAEKMSTQAFERTQQATDQAMTTRFREENKTSPELMTNNFN